MIGVLKEYTAVSRCRNMTTYVINLFINKLNLLMEYLASQNELLNLARKLKELSNGAHH